MTDLSIPDRLPREQPEPLSIEQRQAVERIAEALYVRFAPNTEAGIVIAPAAMFDLAESFVRARTEWRLQQ